MTTTNQPKSHASRRLAWPLLLGAIASDCGGLETLNAEKSGVAVDDKTSTSSLGGSTQTANASGGSLVRAAIGGTLPQGGGRPDILDAQCADGGWALARDPALPQAKDPLGICSGRTAACLASRHEGCKAALQVTSVATSDLNGDGFLDLVMGGVGGREISWFAGRGDGTFGAATAIPVGLDPMQVVLADVNVDGKTDIVVANLSDGTWSILLGDGKGSFNLSTLLMLSDALVGAASTVVADFDRDGHPDLVGENLGTATIYLFSGRGDGTFSGPKTLLGIARGPLATGDLNGDTIPDLVGRDALGAIVALASNGDGTFTRTASLEIGGVELSGIVLADLNQDNRLDLAITKRDWSIAVAKATTTGKFVGFDTSLETGAVPIGLVAADLNGDGLPDLATTCSVAESASIFFNDGNGPRSPYTEYQAGITPRGLAVGDFDRDGKPDLAIANYSVDKYFTVLFGDWKSAVCQ